MRSLASVLLFVAAAFIAAPTSAQIIEEDTVGTTIRIVTVPITLVAGRTYTFRTDYAPTPSGLADTVLTLVGPAQTSVAGSDGCTTPSGFSWLPSCFTYTVPTGAGGTHWLYLRAWRTLNRGSTNLYYRDNGGPEQLITTSGAISFGGGAVARTIPATSPPSTFLHFHTRLRPGANTNHEIWLAASNEWQYVTRAYFNGRVGNTAMLETTNPSGAGWSGSRVLVYGSTQTAGPLQLFENHYAVAFADLDGDGLSSALEASLHTCDTTSSPNPSTGFTCAGRIGCPSGLPSGGATSSLCLASLRDTDHDGLRDDLEVYGYDHPLLYFPWWGANPAHMDVFVELDGYDQNAATPTTCEWVTNTSALNDVAGSTESFYGRWQQVLSQAPASLNPDGLPGVRLHLDTGLGATGSGTEGNMGGGGTCVPLSNIPPNVCDAGLAFNNACVGAAAGTVFFNAARRPFFRYHVDSTLGGGNTGILSTSTVASDMASHLHEMGHGIGLDHSGPMGTTTATNDSHGGGFRANFPSRMSYSYTYVGGQDGSGSSWGSVAFSTGAFTTPIDMLRAPEVCPFGAGVNPTVMTTIGEDVRPGTAGCFDVDWDRNGTIAGVTPARLFGAIQRTNRMIALGFSATGTGYPEPAAADATTVGDVLIWGRLAPDAVTGQYRLALRAEGTGDCVEYPIGVRSTSYVPVGSTEYWHAGSYPGCFIHGTEYRPATGGGTPIWGIGVALTSAIVSSGVEGLLAVTNDGGTLRWSRFNYAASSTAAMEATASVISANSLLTSGASIARGGREPALVRDPVTNETLLVYLSASGNVLRQASLGPAPSAWSTVANSSDGTASVTSAASPDLTYFNGRIYMAATDPATNRIRLYRLAASGSPLASRTWELVVTTNLTTTRRPTLAAARDPDLRTSFRLTLAYVTPAGNLRWAQGPLDSHGTASSWTGTNYFGTQTTVEAPAMVMDDRAFLAEPMRDLRVYRMLAREVGCATSCPPGSPTTCFTCGAGEACSTYLGQTMCTIGADPQMDFELNPFPNGRSPGVFADYNEWTEFPHGICSSLLREAFGSTFLPPGSPYRPTGADAATAAEAFCGPLPVWMEPSSTGMSITAWPSSGDSTTYPYLYESHEPVCP